MVVTTLNMSFVIDEEEASEYTLEGTTLHPPYDNIEIMIQRKKKVIIPPDIIEVGRRYRNLHTGKACVVVDKMFYNIAYFYDGDPKGIYPHYCHYRTFKNNWVLEEKR